MDMWTSLQNAQLAHIPTAPTRAYPQGFAFGLTRFACRTAVLNLKKGSPKTKSKTRGNAVQLQPKRDQLKLTGKLS